jgi:hypothetical protein
MKMKKIFISALLVSLFLTSCKNEESNLVEPQKNEVDSAVFLESLNGSPTSQPVVTTSEGAISATSGQNTTTPNGMNPPHGQPGHRCEIAVGAPLNSAPAAKVTTPAVNPAPVQSVPTPEMKTTSTTPTTATKTLPGMNPPHGQPGHLCEIPVGQPLPVAK